MDPSAATLRPAGWGRYVETAFLGVWLAFWIVGEVFALAFFGAGLVSVLSRAVGRPVHIGPFASGMTDGTAPLFFLFILVWLTLWSFAGWAAGTTFLRTLVGEDRVAVTPEGLWFLRRAGPFRRTRVLPRSSVRRVRLRPPDKALVADTPQGTVTIADLGRPADREVLRRSLAERLGTPDHSRAVLIERETPPHEWSVAGQGLDTVMTSPAPNTARIHAVIGWSVTALVSLGWITTEAVGTAERLALAFTALTAIGAIWLTWARREWVLRRGSMRLRLRLGRWVLRDHTFDHGSFEIEHTVDSDNDDCWTLVVRDDARRRVLASALHDHYELLALGEWLGARTSLPFHRPTV
jgi:hypothetical protein